MTDAAGAVKEMRMDSLGRLVEVIEDPTGKNHSTKYEYEVLDNLTSVKQGTLADRTFGYTSLSRLDSAYNPESGSVGYSYDDAGNLISKVDGRAITTCFGSLVTSVCTASYDGANRALRKAFSDGTPAIDYVYSGERLTNASGGAASIAYGYDEVNRVTSRNVAITGGGTSSVGYSYYPAGISTMTYPSAKVLQYDYEDAGRTTSAAIG